MSPDAAGGPHRRPRTGPETYPHYPTYPQADSACSDSKDHETFNSWPERPPGNGRKIQPPAGKKRPLSDEAHDLPAGRPEEARAKPKPGGASLPTQAERGSEGNPAAPQSSEQGTAKREFDEGNFNEVPSPKRDDPAPPGTGHRTRDSGGWWRHQPPLSFGASSASGIPFPAPFSRASSHASRGHRLPFISVPIPACGRLGFW